MDRTKPSTAPRSREIAEFLLLCGVASPLVYVATDVAAAAAYPGYSFADQAVSELFAIGAPTRYPVVLLFSVASALLVGFAAGILASSPRDRAQRLIALMFAGSAIVGLVLWNVFPMHMRGTERTFTDTMHLILATNPFVLGTLIVSAFAYQNWFRMASIAVLTAIIGLALFGFHYAPAIDAGEATPGMGLSERAAQYLYGAWQVTLAVLVLRSTKLRPLEKGTPFVAMDTRPNDH